MDHLGDPVPAEELVFRPVHSVAAPLVGRRNSPRDVAA
jgi:hypothetical protein